MPTLFSGDHGGIAPTNFARLNHYHLNYLNRSNRQPVQKVQVVPRRFGLSTVVVSIRQRYGHENERLLADDPRDVAFAGGIVSEHDIAGFESTNDAITGFDVPRA